jgi:acyl-coenzyme A thioesterase PaaI-like protein
LRKIEISAGVFRRGINLWPPFMGAGIRVTRVTPDFREIDVKLKFGMLNRNYFGTQFGGSMFAMTDPFFALMMMRNLGPDYVVWDKSATIEYVKPGRGDVFALFVLTGSAIDHAKRATADGDKHEPLFRVKIRDAGGETIAEATKTLYIRRRAPAAP